MAKSISKSELIAAVADEVGIEQTKARRVVDATFETIVKSLKKKTDVAIVGFGTFSVSARKARKGRNPKTGEVIKIKASKLPKFKAGKGLKDAVN